MMKITIKDIIEYLQKYDLETQVCLDRDGWFVQKSDHSVKQKIIDNSGLFHYSEEQKILFINN